MTRIVISHHVSLVVGVNTAEDDDSFNNGPITLMMSKTVNHLSLDPPPPPKVLLFIINPSFIRDSLSKLISSLLQSLY